MEEAGPSITVTSLTNILSFAIGILTPTPAISIFCLYTCVGVAVDFVYQLTFFVAALVYEEMRIAEPEKPPITDVAQCEGCGGSQIVCTIGASSRSERLDYCSWSFLIGYWLASLYGCLKMEIRMDTTNLIMKDSPLHNVAYIYENFLWKEGQLVLVFVNNPPDLSIEHNQRRMLGLVSEFEGLRYSMGKNSTSFWLRSFLYQSALYQTKEGFYSILDEWLQKMAGQDGMTWWRLQRNMSGAVVGVNKFMFATAAAMGEEASWNTRARLQHAWRAVAKRNEQFNVSKVTMRRYRFYHALLSSVFGLPYDSHNRYDIHKRGRVWSTFPMERESGSDIDVHNIDEYRLFRRLYCLYISYHFYRNPASWTTDERLADALRSIGWPMIQAGCSTILCISALLLIDSYMVYVFTKTIYLVISLGLLHGIVFLPALLLTHRTMEWLQRFSSIGENKAKTALLEAET
ncbi:patched family protein, partial [Ostertagia ostertagi]